MTAIAWCNVAIVLGVLAIVVTGALFIYDLPRRHSAADTNGVRS